MDTPQDRFACYRILDVNFNRCVEGLRVAEEFARFRLESRTLARLCKELRHRLTDIIQKSGIRNAILSSRDTLGDVGTRIETASEYKRGSLREVVEASFQRVEQSLRSLEEYSKPIDASIAKEFEAVRYSSYTVEKAFAVDLDSNAHLDGCKLYVLIDGRSSLSALQQMVDQLVAAGVHAIQLRDKRLEDRELLERAELVRRRTEAFETLFIMNDRPDIAALADADGVHLGQTELPVSAARRILGESRIVGVSTHSLAEAEQAVWDGANYVGVGPVFPSRTKTFDRFVGVDLLKQVSGSISLPTFAIGGIDLENVEQVIKAGCQRIAVGHAITSSNSIQATVECFLKLLCDSTTNMD